MRRRLAASRGEPMNSQLQNPSSKAGGARSYFLKSRRAEGPSGKLLTDASGRTPLSSRVCFCECLCETVERHPKTIACCYAACAGARQSRAVATKGSAGPLRRDYLALTQRLHSCYAEMRKPSKRSFSGIELRVSSWVASQVCLLLVAILGRNHCKARGELMAYRCFTVC